LTGRRGWLKDMKSLLAAFFRLLLGSSVGGGCEGDSGWEGEDDVSQAGGGGDRLLTLCACCWPVEGDGGSEVC